MGMYVERDNLSNLSLFSCHLSVLSHSVALHSYVGRPIPPNVTVGCNKQKGKGVIRGCCPCSISIPFSSLLEIATVAFLLRQRRNSDVISHFCANCPFKYCLSRKNRMNFYFFPPFPVQYQIQNFLNKFLFARYL